MFRVAAPFTLEPAGLKDWNSGGVAEYVCVWVGVGEGLRGER